MAVRPAWGTQAAAIIVAALVLMSPGIAFGYIITHSSMFNVSWAEGFAAALARGEAYPRWLPDMNDGMGSPVFYFYAPLPFYLTAPLVWLTGAPGLAVVLGSALMLALSGLAGLLLFREFAGPRTSLMLAIAYMAMPYHLLVDVWVRGAYAEQAAFIFLPLAVLCLWRLPRDWRYVIGLALATAGQAMSHLPSALFFAATMTALSLWLAWRQRSWRVLALAALGGGIGLLASAVYVLPALALQPAINPQFWSIYLPGDNPVGHGRQVFDVLLLVSTLLPAALLFSAAWLARGDRDLWPWLLLGIAVLFLVSPFASPLWPLLGPLQIVQFPWRSLFVLDLFALIVLALALRRNRPKAGELPKLLFIGIALLVAMTAMARHSAGPERGSSLRTSEREEMQRLAVKADAVEYLPACIPLPARYLGGVLSTGLLLEDYRTRTFAPDRLRVFHYPFLEVTAGDKVLATSCDPASGLIVADVPSGMTATVRRRPAPIETVATSITAAAFLALVVLGFFGWRKGERRRS
ncbi:MAG: hypothetical protein U1F47_12805 [Hyphomicrobiales bacterium]